ncbi:MAG: hypothetical protein LN569_03850 [Rickettsia endosymbiont of Labidopullus appendiculatus]|nr:hypothetical protein [Rickettsia endosymbiont of Labidopullus appendiculatus]
MWIGYNVTIIPGIKIGDGAIIAANSTITKMLILTHSWRQFCEVYKEKI